MCSHSALILGAGICVIVGGPTRSDAARPGVPLAKMTVAGSGVERELSGVWTAVTDGDLLRVGDRIRTGPESTVTINFPWTIVVLSPSSSMFVPTQAVLVLELDSGRLEQSSKGADVIKIHAGGALVRGAGQVVVWRRDRTTTVTARLGRFQVRSRGGSLELMGAAAIVHDRKKPALRALPFSPGELLPGIDPIYVERGRPIDLAWRPTTDAMAYHVEVVAIGSDEAVVHAESREPSVSVLVPWPGTFRWRVFTVDEENVEGLPSRNGFFCIPGY
jgi:hypothetical protein